MNLTDNEKRDLIKLIEADKPLPDAFRFKLFADKREVAIGVVDVFGNNVDSEVTL